MDMQKDYLEILANASGRLLSAFIKLTGPACPLSVQLKIGVINNRFDYIFLRVLKIVSLMEISASCTILF